MLVFKHIWILFIFVHLLYGFLWWKRSQVEIRKDPNLLRGYKTLIRGWLQYGSIPWIIMGVGILTGAVDGVFQYFNPRNGAFVYLFYLSVVALWIAVAYWIFIRDGAEKLLRHPGLIEFKTENPNVVKLWIAFSLLGGIFGLSMMLFGNIPTPNF